MVNHLAIFRHDPNLTFLLVKIDGTILHGWSPLLRLERVFAMWSGSYHVTKEASRFILSDEDASRVQPSRAGAYQWAELMQRTFALDVLACPRCGGRLRLVALIEQAAVVQRILRHLGLPAEVPEPRPARAPPRQSETFEDQSRDVPEFDPA